MDELERLTGDFQPDPESALAGTMRRARRRRAARRTGSAVLSLAIFGGGLALVWTAFDSPDGQSPLAGPTSPSPTVGPDESTHCDEHRGEMLCITKTGSTVRLASASIGDRRFTLYGFRATLEVLASNDETPMAWEPRTSAVCLGWPALDFGVTCFAGYGSGVQGGHVLGSSEKLLQAPPDETRLLLPDPFGELDPSDFGPGAGPGHQGSWLHATWTSSATHHVKIVVEGQSVDPILVGPFPHLGTEAKMILAVLPQGSSARYQAYTEDERLLWQEVFLREAPSSSD